MRYAKWLDLTQFQGFEVQLKKMLAQIKVGDILFSEVKTYDKDTHEAVVEMHKFPRVNGGLIVVDRGEVRAVVSGFDTKGFNRAIAARRPPGSVFKSLVYYAGLTLGWNLTDQLDNERQIFPYQGQFYYPSPDHESPYSQTSILWSGAMSENLASVSLTARLVEKLNLEQFKELMGFLGLMPLDGESPQDFHFRVAKAVGVQLEPEGVREFQLTNAIRDLEPDLIFEGQQSVHAQLKKMWWGKGYTAEIGNIYQAPDDDVPADRKAARIKLAKNNFLRMGKLMGNLSEDWSAIERKIQEVGIDQATNDPDVRSRLRFFRVLPASGNKPELGYVRTYDDENPPANVRNLAAIQAELPTPGRELNALDVQAIWDTNVLLGNAEVTVTDVKLDGYLPAGLYTQLTQYVEQRYQNIMATDEKYEFTKYYQHHDFRIALGLEYLVLLTRALGVQSPLEPVLSYPLGSNDVTAAEVAKIYQSFISGKIYRFYEEGSSNQLNFIRRVEDRFGNVLYEPKRKEIQLTAPEYSAQMREILRRTVTHGTGRSARGELHVVIGGDENGKGGKPISIPAFGKTGTTNDYTNAYFAGFLPYPTEKNMPLDVENSYVITSYVGYDHNLSMKRGGLRISGAQGALPAWIGLAKAIFEKKKYADFLDVLDLNVVSRGEWPISYLEGTVPVKIDLPRGVVLRRGEDIEEERYALTNVEETGETFQNEFVVGNLVKSTVRVPIGDGGEPARKFGLFNRDDEGVATLEPEISSSEKEKPKVESKEVDTRPVSQDPIQTPPPGTEQNEEVEAAPPEEARTKTEKPIQGASETATRPPEEELFEPAAEPEGTEEGGFVEEELW
jgi:membrane peptidoglycan carboxypeptidase